jgi:hypothetical protein
MDASSSRDTRAKKVALKQSGISEAERLKLELFENTRGREVASMEMRDVMNVIAGACLARSDHLLCCMYIQIDQLQPTAQVTLAKCMDIFLNVI